MAFELYKVNEWHPNIHARPDKIAIDPTCEKIILYHGTVAEDLDKILRQGLLPRKVTGNTTSNNGWMESNPELVYLADFYYAMISANSAVCVRGGKTAVLQVEVDTSRLEPDEDRVEMAENNGRQLTTWYESLVDGYPLFAACAHRGPILPEQFRNIWVVNDEGCGKSWSHFKISEGKLIVVEDSLNLARTLEA